MRKGVGIGKKWGILKYLSAEFFSKKPENILGQRVYECRFLGQKLGYDRCPYLSFFIWRLEDEIFDLIGRRDLNTKYAYCWPKMLMKCSWCNYECRTAKMIWLGQETTTGFPYSLKKGIRLRWGKYSFTGENDCVLLYWFRMIVSWIHLLTRHTGDDTLENDG